MESIKRKLSSFHIIILGFTAVILLGTLLLTLPFASKAGGWTPFIDALFTSTSAVCVTGLVVLDTATGWTMFGQIVILCLIQIGGIGVVTIAASLAALSGRKIGIFSRETIKNAISAPNVGGIVHLTGFIVKGCLLIEGIGAVIMLPFFCIDYGAAGIWMAIFHSVSAFCNAGFDVMGEKTGQFSSLTGYVSHPVINITIILLIVIGGIGFLVWEDVVTHKWRFRRYKTQSKIVFAVSGILILLPALYFFFFECSDLSFGRRLAASIFQAVTPRTAGFNTLDLVAFSGVGRGIVIVLMLIGGSPGSTAGGMKTTTVAVLFASTIAVFRKKDNAELMKRRVDDATVKTAAAILLMYVTIFLTSGMIISAVEGLPIGDCLFESASAVGTVGLSLGVTQQIGIVSKLILIVCMFFGRVGGLTLIYAAFGGNRKQVAKLPLDVVSVG
ncbi:MAG: Trk family potassium uptake protein [Clostridia bacterium]|nr:Trk family potassium uptake protein [Clostridia bacterium]MBR5043743.1 Trk family potassium uptake protein [Clostridia bacterium]